MAIASTYAVGARGSVAVGEELIYGTSVQPSHLIGITSEAIENNENSITSAELSADRSIRQIVRSSFDVSGDINLELNPSGHGILYKHACGEYTRLQRVDGSIRGRIASAPKVIEAGDSALDAYQILHLADEKAVVFDDTGTFAIAYRDAFGNLTSDDNAGAGHAYEANSSNVLLPAIVKVVNTASTSGSGDHDDTTQDHVAIDLGVVYDAAGNAVNPSVATTGAVRLANGLVVPYFNAIDLGAGLGTRLVLHRTATEGNPADAATYPAVNEYVEVVPSLTLDPSFAFVSPAGEVGNFVMQHHATGWDGVWTHHIETGAELPVGLTVEVDRDAGVFIYTGMKVNSMTLTMENQQIATGAFNLIGKREYASASLVNVVLEDAATIVIEGDEAAAFPDPVVTGNAYEVVTIGDRTDIRYNTLTVNPDGTVTLGGIPSAPADGAIDRFYPVGTNVDSRSQTRKTTDLRQSVNSPLVGHEIHVVQDGQSIEAQALSITMSNNINGDKYVLGSKERVAAIEQRRTVEGSLTFEYDDGFQYHKFKKGTFFAVEARCISEADDALISGASPAVVATAVYFLPKCRYKGGTPNIEGEDYITHEMPFDASRDTDLNTTDLCVTLVNANQFDAQDS